MNYMRHSLVDVCTAAQHLHSAFFHVSDSHLYVFFGKTSTYYALQEISSEPPLSGTFLAPIETPLCSCVYSVISDSLQPHGLQPTMMPCPWNFLGKNTGVGCHFLIQGIFLTQGSNLGLLYLLHWQTNPLPLSHLGSYSILLASPKSFQPDFPTEPLAQEDKNVSPCSLASQ